MYVHEVYGSDSEAPTTLYHWYEGNRRSNLAARYALGRTIVAPTEQDRSALAKFGENEDVLISSFPHVIKVNRLETFVEFGADWIIKATRSARQTGPLNVTFLTSSPNESRPGIPSDEEMSALLGMARIVQENIHCVEVQINMSALITPA